MVLSGWLILLICIVIVFDLLNGFNDSGDITATIISSHTLKARTALLIASVAGFAGPFIFGVAVAKAIGSNIVVQEYITVPVLIAALTGASAWSFITWFYGIPTSSSHNLIGGLIGAVIMHSGLKALYLKGLMLIIIALISSPIIGYILGWLLFKGIRRLLKNATPKANVFFKAGQIPTTIALALGNGANDSQKTMGIITLGLISAGNIEAFYVPFWVILLCAGTKSIGTLIGGWRVIRLMGTRFYKIKPIHSFTSQLASSFVIITSSILGGPVSTTQVVNMSIIGAGAGERISKVRWQVVKDILLSWLFTIPVSAVIAALTFLIISFFNQ